MAIASDSMLGVSSLPPTSRTASEIKQRAGAEKKHQEPDRQISVMDALYRHRKFRIGEGEIDNSAEPIALDLFGEEMRDQFGERQCAHCQPERLAADAAVEPVEQINPIHLHYAG